MVHRPRAGQPEGAETKGGLPREDMYGCVVTVGLVRMSIVTLAKSHAGVMGITGTERLSDAVRESPNWLRSVSISAGPVWSIRLRVASQMMMGPPPGMKTA